MVKSQYFIRYIWRFLNIWMLHAIKVAQCIQQMITYKSVRYPKGLVSSKECANGCFWFFFVETLPMIQLVYRAPSVNYTGSLKWHVMVKELEWYQNIRENRRFLWNHINSVYINLFLVIVWFGLSTKWYSECMCVCACACARACASACACACASAGARAWHWRVWIISSHLLRRDCNVGLCLCISSHMK